ncbi:2-amino-4-hydroxy-6-hydroxymethyldihydropteridine diphosphokinase [Thalassolituus hydrocarboniclasticus]|uniref:2-amino-4-hydroxy-6-hydroxymethyldihydropteridine pyrophosphokinase n=1 Tax=Thalassolituus hydrocarboniclasticus TaxID=2742796 RepID=A0ABY6AAL8_9GAMM|nr:2-amino-4-hydroxy-6-hydroxymethyldihydropteridine diphosphokinase [Thalassolituus hydrocarboniclasticus]UXD88054.1 2-amino-4-hydroxy-6-hydroxymethyldihydropteridine diphosphokinase [Thalassolituus hydrocarboniclasticus]
MRFYLLGLGSNIDPEQHMLQAREALASLGTLCAQSPVLRSAPVGDTFHFEFKNQLLILSSELLPGPLKQRLQKIEVDLGREPKNPSRKIKDRTIDIDILAMAASAAECRNTPLEESYYRELQQLWHQEENV